MKNLIIAGVVGILIGAISMYFIRKCDTEPIEIPISVEVPVPGVKDSFPYEVPILKPYPVENPINKKLAEELANAKNKIDSLNLLLKFVEPKLYTKTFKDTVQSIKVDMIASGSVDSVKVEYEIYPRKIKYDTIIYKDISKQASFWVKGSVLLPFQESKMLPSIKPGIMFIPKKGKLAYDAEVDFINKGAEIGLLFKF